MNTTKRADDLASHQTWLGFNKTHGRINHDINLLEQAGRHDEAAKLREYLPKNFQPTYNPHRAVAQARQQVVQAQQAAKNDIGGGGSAMYGLGGAGAGALLGAAIGNKKNRTRNALIGSALGGGAGLIAHGLLNPPPKTANDATTKQADMQGLINKLMPYLQQAKTTGGNFLKSDIGRHALGGGAIGAGLGGLAGLVAPGYDEEGKRRGRFGAMLRGALGGGALGAGAGGALGYAAPNLVPGLINAGKTRNMPEAQRVLGEAGRDARESVGLPTDRQKLTPRQDVTTSGDVGRAPAPVTNANRPNYSVARMGSSNSKLQTPGVTVPSATNPMAGRSNALVEPGRGESPTLGSSVAGGLSATTNKNVPNFKTDNMKAPTSSTYTPTDAGAVAKMRAIEKAKADAKQKSLVDMLQGTTGKAKLDAQTQQNQLDEAVGVSNASPEVLAMKQRDPEGFARILQAARDKQVEENLRTAPNRGFDASGIDMNAMAPPVSATLGR